MEFISDRKQDRTEARKQIREFLATRGARLTPEQAGLPVLDGNRRVKGLRRVEVATLAGISVEYYGRLERGDATGVSESVLDGIHHALQPSGPRPCAASPTRGNSGPTSPPHW
ncbi:helix-turn-helix domain-containing protein [Streptomyces sp. NPDC088794]|uniref:helix-turn-helix domain-containing protein n=1 Tax=Streptomyces sp. NPDC088794 TaxID=3365902 RepID=UPI003804D0F5